MLGLGARLVLFGWALLLVAGCSGPPAALPSPPGRDAGATQAPAMLPGRPDSPRRALMPGRPSHWASRSAERLLERASAGAAARVTSPCGRVTSALVPHHLVAAPLVAATLMGVQRRVSTVVLLVPDHRNISPHAVSTSVASWRTSRGTVEPAGELAQELAAEGFVAVDERGFAREHAIRDLIPFVQRAFPAAKLLPLRFRGLRCEDGAPAARRLGKRLAELLEPDALVVASIDFVHAKPQAEAKRLDRQSALALQSLEPSRACTAEADSPLALVTLLAHAKAAGAEQWVGLGRSDSHELGASSAAEVVSYQTAYLTRQQCLPVTVLAAGDVMLGRGLTARMRARNDFRYPLAGVAQVLRRADLALANLEAQLVPDCPTAHRGLQLCADPLAVAALREAGIDAVSVANNHAQDFGPAGLAASVKLLRRRGIEVAGYDGPVRLERKGTRLSVLAYDAIRGPFDSRRMAEEIAAERAASDAVIVLMHWGREHRAEPSARQRRLAAAAAAAGAQLVIGSHPHAVQPVELLGRTTAAYSLGNLVFDQDEPPTARQGALGSFAFCRGRLTRAELVPVTISHEGAPSLGGSAEGPSVDGARRAMP